MPGPWTVGWTGGAADDAVVLLGLQLGANKGVAYEDEWDQAPEGDSAFGAADAVIVMGPVLQMKAFSKSQRVGTYVLAATVLALPDVGAADQSATQDVAALLTAPAALAVGGASTLAPAVRL